MAPLFDAIKASRPILYWRGRPETGIWRDFSGHGNHSTTSAGTVGRGRADVPGDPLSGWVCASVAASVNLGGAISGFNASDGTIMTVVYVNDFASGLSLRGFFDTAPGAVGALRVFTANDFFQMRRDVGGEASAAAFSNVIYQGRFALNGGRRFRMIALHWTGGINWVTMDGAYISDLHTMTVTPVTTNFAWGSINGNSLSSFSIFHSAAVWNRCLNIEEIASLHRSMMTPTTRTVRLTRARPYWGTRVG